MNVVRWPLAATPQVRMPPACAATDRPAETWLDVPLRRFDVGGRYALGALPLLGLSRPPLAVVRLPVTRDVARRWRRAQTLLWTGRWLVLLAPLALVAAVVVAVLAAGAGFPVWIAYLFLVVLAVPVGLGLAGLATSPLNVNVAGDAVQVAKVTDGFAGGLMQANPPGLVQADARPVGGPRR